MLRIVDPRLQSRTLEDYGLAYLLLGPLEIIMLMAVPPLVAEGHILVTGTVLTLGAILCIGLASRLIGGSAVQTNPCDTEELAVIRIEYEAVKQEPPSG